MGSTAVTPNANANPFDTPLPSEVNEHQQAVAASPTGNPFDEPLPSEKADSQAVANGQLPASATVVVPKYAGHVPWSDTSSPSKITPEQAAGGIAAGAVVGAAPTVLPAIMSHLSSLKNILDYAGKIGLGGMGYKEAREIYKEFSK